MSVKKRPPPPPPPPPRVIKMPPPPPPRSNQMPPKTAIPDITKNKSSDKSASKLEACAAESSRLRADT